MVKEKGKIGYQISRFVGSPLFKICYNPMIINKGYIPKDGPVLLCGNHLHVWDQFPVICSTKRTSHWMSKKEYFDSKLGPFFKLTGAICVDRNGDASEATDISLEYLELGSVVGLFPEGTRNGLKSSRIKELYNITNQEYNYEDFYKKIRQENPLESQVNLLLKLYEQEKISNEMLSKYIFNVDESLIKFKNESIIDEEQYDNSLLLPFKYGAVSMAAKSNAQVVPFAVNGNYNVGSDSLIVRFGAPFCCHSGQLEEDNKILRNKFLTLEKQNLEYIREKSSK